MPFYSLITRHKIVNLIYRVNIKLQPTIYNHSYILLKRINMSSTNYEMVNEFIRCSDLKMLEKYFDIPDIDTDKNIYIILKNAIFKNYKSIFDIIISRKDFNINKVCEIEENRNLLHYSCVCGDIYYIKKILKMENIDVNCISKFGNNALIDVKDLSKMKLLLNHPDIDVNIIVNRDIYNEMKECYKFDKSISSIESFDSDEYYDYCAKVTNYDIFTPLIKYILDGNVKAVKLLLQHPKIDVNLPINSFSPLMYAIHNRQIKIARMLLQREDIDINYRNKHKDTALMMLSKLKNPFLIELMLNKKNIDVNLLNKNGDSALLTSIVYGNIEMSKMLLTHPNIKPDLRGDNRYTPFIFACSDGHVELVEIMMNRNGVDINLNCNNTTPLESAARNGEIKIVDMLLKRKDIIVNVKNCNGNTPLIMACSYGHIEIIKMLLENGADINIQSNFNMTALMWAVQSKYKKVIEMLLENEKIDVTLKNNNGEDALMIAKENGDPEIIDMLTKK